MVGCWTCSQTEQEALLSYIQERKVETDGLRDALTRSENDRVVLEREVRLLTDELAAASADKTSTAESERAARRERDAAAGNIANLQRQIHELQDARAHAEAKLSAQQVEVDELNAVQVRAARMLCCGSTTTCVILR